MEEQFKESMRRLAGAVTVITAGNGLEAAGLTATAVCSLSMNPPRMLVCLNRHGATFAQLLETRMFAVNVLSLEERDVAERFAGRTGLAGRDKFTAGEWNLDQGRPPRLRSAMAAIECSVHTISLADTHGVVFGDVTAVSLGAGGAPLLYHDQKFSTLEAIAQT